jgi:aspartyl-tRNA(Asn)/glutamyl-tRNA(Gln) amidotransferase subunit A
MKVEGELMNNLAFADIKTLRELLAQKKISPAELLDYTISRFKKYDNQLASALELFDRDSILEDLKKDGLLHAIPGLLKDNIAQRERKLSCASKILQNFSSTYDATASARLKNAGGLLIGRANCDEFAMGSSTETSAYLKTKNPWDASRVPGGSSGGSAAAVAAGLVSWSLGSETGGSVRQPAALCGIVGSKPTYGRVSRYGLVAYASSLDQIGVFSRSVYDNALVLSAISGSDEHDSTTLQSDAPDFTQGLDGKLPSNCVLGVVENALHVPGVDPELVNAIEEALLVFEKMGATIKRITLPTLDYSAAAYFILSRAEAASNLARFDGVRYGMRAEEQALLDMYRETRHDGFGTEVKVRIMVGNYVLSAGYAAQFYENAKRVQTLIRQEFIDAFKSVNAIIMPTSPAGAFKFNAFEHDKLQMDLQDYFTCGVNIAGIPAISIPCGMSKEQLPFGMQIITAHEQEALMFKIAHAFEQQTPWHTLNPPHYLP